MVCAGQITVWWKQYSGQGEQKDIEEMQGKEWPQFRRETYQQPVFQGELDFNFFFTRRRVRFLNLKVKCYVLEYVWARVDSQIPIHFTISFLADYITHLGCLIVIICIFCWCYHISFYLNLQSNKRKSSPKTSSPVEQKERNHPNSGEKHTSSRSAKAS